RRPDGPAVSRGRVVPVRAGAVFAILYAGVAVFTAIAGPGRSRPLFDGFAPPPPSRWVHPPKEFVAGNEPPKPSTIDVNLGPTGSAISSGSSGDGQVILSFPAGAFPAHPPDTKVVALITPLDPASLAPPPTGLEADGNAYRLDFTYDPSKQPDTALSAPADVFLVVPEPAQTLLFSTDGRSWASLPFRPVPDPTQVGGSITAPGFLLAAAPPVARPASTSTSSGDGSRVAVVAAITAGLALVLYLAPLGWRALR